MAQLRAQMRRIREKILLPVLVGQDEMRDLLGSVRAELQAYRFPSDVRSAEFRVYSQFGEDGIIQYLIGKVPIDNQFFVEFGVEDYRESNTRFLAVNNGWSGLILDGGSRHIDLLHSRDWAWKAGIEARSAFITRENVNAVIGCSVQGDIGVLSVDIDGVDYWVLQAIEVVSPRILVVEYNSVFGPSAAVTVPYRPDFDRRLAHRSGMYFGASIAALTLLCHEKNYALVGGNAAGCNAFFVRRDVLGDLQEVSPKAAWVRSRFRGVLDGRGGRLNVDAHDAARTAIADLPLLDVRDGRMSRAGTLLGWDAI